MRRAITVLACIALLVSVGINTYAAPEPIVIGFITALTGGTSLWGNQERNGAVLAAEEINAKGGILGRPIKLIVYDHKGQPAEGVSAYRRLVDEDKAVVIGGTHFSNISLAIAPVAEQKKVPIIGQAIEPKVTVPEPGKVNMYTFLAQPSSAQQGQMMARFAFENLGAKSAACLSRQVEFLFDVAGRSLQGLLRIQGRHRNQLHRVRGRNR